MLAFYVYSTGLNFVNTISRSFSNKVTFKDLGKIKSLVTFNSIADVLLALRFVGSKLITNKNLCFPLIIYRRLQKSGMCMISNNVIFVKLFISLNSLNL